jgi:hypothetical protein
VQKGSPRGLVLNTEKGTVKFNKHIVIRNKPINRKKVLVYVWDIENIFSILEMNRLNESGQYAR